jgi:hypothetical protein
MYTQVRPCPSFVVHNAQATIWGPNDEAGNLAATISGAGVAINRGARAECNFPLKLLSIWQA